MSNPNNLLEIENFPFKPMIIQKLKKAKLLSSKSILNLSVLELQRLAQLSISEANNVVQTVSAAELKANTTTAFTMLSSHKRYLNFEFFSQKFGSIYPGTITEIWGESGVGKTQLCLFLSICAMLPSYLADEVSNVIYIHSEGEFPVQRFIDISEAFKKRNMQYHKLTFTDNLMLKKVHNLKETIHVLQNGIPDLLTIKVVPKVLIIDSVADLLRGEYDSLNDRNIMIRLLAVELWKLASIHKMVVICVNQVSGSMQKSDTAGKAVFTDIPSLGLLWAHVLTSRIKVYRHGNPALRAFEVVFSAYHPRLVVNFSISSDGIETLSDCLL